MAPDHVHPLTMTGPGEADAVAPGKLLAGSGATTAWNAFSDASGRFHVGHWRHGPGRIAVAYDEDELCVIVAGEAVLTDDAGHSARFGPGDAFAISAGFTGTWESVGEVTKIYAILLPEG